MVSTKSYSDFPLRIFRKTKYPRLLLCRKWLLISNYSSTRRGLIWFLLASSTKRVPIAKHVISFRTRFFLSQNFRIINVEFLLSWLGYTYLSALQARTLAYRSFIVLNMKFSHSRTKRILIWWKGERKIAKCSTTVRSRESVWGLSIVE